MNPHVFVVGTPIPITKAHYTRIRPPCQFDFGRAGFLLPKKIRIRVRNNGYFLLLQNRVRNNGYFCPHFPITESLKNTQKFWCSKLYHSANGTCKGIPLDPIGFGFGTWNTGGGVVVTPPLSFLSLNSSLLLLLELSPTGFRHRPQGRFKPSGAYCPSVLI